MPDLTGDPKSHDVAQLAEGLSGTCLFSGSFAASNLIIEEAKVDIDDREGTLTKFLDTQTGSGTPLDRYFCSRCGNPIKSVTPLYPEKVVLKMGLFPRIPAPEFETFSLHRHEWQGSHPDVDKYKIKAFAERL
ncbi:hypothetical protein MW887_012096 [Aspergillus wentii]|nr:hypothetical protein MW887_012096 [Aspergillus wentii]